MAKKTIVPPGYQPGLDREPPRPSGGCSGAVVFAIAIVAAMIGGGVLLIGRLSASGADSLPTVAAASPVATILSATPAPTDAPTATLDGWSLTGTALLYATASPTVDYCWWLTNTPTNTPTLVYTPDAWSATGTAVHLAENPPVEPTSTPDLPHVWCNHIPTATATITPLSLRTREATPTDEPTDEPTARPRNSGGGSGGAVPTVYIWPTPEPVIVQPTIPIPPEPTIKPTKKRRKKTKTPTPTMTPVIIVVTATPTATETPTETATATYTETATETPTETATATETAIPEPSELAR